MSYPGCAHASPGPGPDRCRTGRRRGPRHRGASLVEVLVAVLVLSVGLLGLAGMQLRALRGSQSSVQRTQAVFLGQYLLDLMRVDRQSALQGDYNTPASPAAPSLCTVPSPPGTGLAKTEFHAWFTQVKSQMGRAGDHTTCVRVDCTAQGLCVVELQWDDSASGGLAAQRLSLSTRI